MVVYNFTMTRSAKFKRLCYWKQDTVMQFKSRCLQITKNTNVIEDTLKYA